MAAILRVIEEQARRLHRHALAARRIVREELEQLQGPDCPMVGGEGLPYRRRLATACQLAFARASRLPMMTAMSSFHDLTNDLAPSSWSRAARRSTSTPAAAKRARTSSVSPPSR